MEERFQLIQPTQGQHNLRAFLINFKSSDLSELQNPNLNFQISFSSANAATFRAFSQAESHDFNFDIQKEQRTNQVYTFEKDHPEKKVWKTIGVIDQKLTFKRTLNDEDKSRIRAQTSSSTHIPQKPKTTNNTEATMSSWEKSPTRTKLVMDDDEEDLTKQFRISDQPSTSSNENSPSSITAHPSPKKVVVDQSLTAEQEEDVNQIMQYLAPESRSKKEIESFMNKDIEERLLQKVAMIKQTKQGIKWSLKPTLISEIDISWKNYTKDQQDNILRLFRKKFGERKMKGEEKLGLLQDTNSRPTVVSQQSEPTHEKETEPSRHKKPEAKPLLSEPESLAAAKPTLTAPERKKKLKKSGTSAPDHGPTGTTISKLKPTKKSKAKEQKDSTELLKSTSTTVANSTTAANLGRPKKKNNIITDSVLTEKNSKKNGSSEAISPPKQQAIKKQKIEDTDSSFEETSQNDSFETTAHKREMLLRIYEESKTDWVKKYDIYKDLHKELVKNKEKYTDLQDKWEQATSLSEKDLLAKLIKRNYESDHSKIETIRKAFEKNVKELNQLKEKMRKYENRLLTMTP